MAMDPRIALMGQQPTFSLMDWGQVMGRGQQLQGNQLVLQEEQRQQAEAAALRQAYAQQYGGGAPPAGLAGVTPMAPPGAEPPVQERQLGGQPTAAFQGGQAPPGGPQAPQGLAGLGGQMGGLVPGGGGLSQPGGGAGLGQNREFINKLYTISPKAGREAEAHAYASQELQFKQHLERVEYLGRVADSILEVDTQEGYTLGRQMLLQAGMPENQMPVAYDKTYVRMLSGTARDSKDKLQLAQAAVALSKEQRERNLQATQAPDYGYKDLNPFIYQRYGSQLAPGQPPTPEMVRQAQADQQQQTVQLEGEKTLAKEQAELTTAAAKQQAQEAGKLAADRPALQRRVQAQMGQLERGWQTVDEDVDQALKILEENPALRQTGVWGAAVVPGTPAYTLRQLLKTIQANVGFDKLQQMREASPTGGALGQVSDKENELLAATAGSLDPKQSADQLERNLRRIKGDVAALRTEKRRAFEQEFGTTGPTSGRAPAGPPGQKPATATPATPPPAAGQTPATAKPGPADTPPVTPDEIAKVMVNTGQTAEQVITTLRNQGYRIEGLD